MKLTDEEKKWLERFKRTMRAAPESLRTKMGAYTIGDPCITLYDKVKYDEHTANQRFDEEKDVGDDVANCDAYFDIVYFPFQIDSTAG